MYHNNRYAARDDNTNSFFFSLNIIVQHSKLKSHSHQAPKF